MHIRLCPSDRSDLSAGIGIQFLQSNAALFCTLDHLLSYLDGVQSCEVCWIDEDSILDLLECIAMIV